MDIKEFTKKEVQLGSTKFIINKLHALDGYTVLESLRETLGETLGNIDMKSPLEGVIKSIMKLPASYIKDELMPALFKEVVFINKSAPQGMALEGEGADRMAFQDLDPVEIYELLARALCVNFYQSFAGKLSSFLAEKKS